MHVDEGGWLERLLQHGVPVQCPPVPWAVVPRWPEHQILPEQAQPQAQARPPGPRLVREAELGLHGARALPSASPPRVRQEQLEALPPRC